MATSSIKVPGVSCASIGKCSSCSRLCKSRVPTLSSDCVQSSIRLEEGPPFTSSLFTNGTLTLSDRLGMEFGSAYSAT